MKTILFVINTLGTGGAEKALMEIFRHLDKEKFNVYLFVLMNQGELIREVPDYVTVLNKNYDRQEILEKRGRKHVFFHVLKSMFSHGAIFRFLPYFFKELFQMMKNHRVLPDKIMWQIVACGAERFDKEFDLAVAFHEGGSTYYVSNYVKAKRKASFIHISFSDAGYSRSLDRDCYDRIDRIFPVSEEAKREFLKVYPELEEKTSVFHNIIPVERIIEKANNGTGFKDDFDGKRIVSIGRISTQKAYEYSVRALKVLKEKGIHARWYVLGEGPERKRIEKEIKALGIKEDFILLGNVDNPYPYLKECDLYVHASGYEGKAIAIQEAQIFSKPIIVTDCNGNREQVEDRYDGMICELDSEKIALTIEKMISDQERAEQMGRNAYKRIEEFPQENEIAKLLELVE